MEITAKAVKDLRDRTGAGMMDCKRALTEAAGEVDAAEKILRKQDKAKASKSASRSAKEGAVHSYIHAGGRLGVLLELNCETDFAAKSDEFAGLLRDLGMHIAAAGPRFVTADQVTEDVLATEREIYRAQVEDSGKPENVIEKIVEGKLKSFYAEHCLLDQAFVREPSITIRERIEQTIGKIKENVQVRRFVRFKLGEDGCEVVDAPATAETTTAD